MKVLDLFSGAGGLSMGFESAGFDVRGIEIHDYLVAMQRENGLRAKTADVRLFKPTLQYDVVSGGPPCPCFSYAGDREGTSVEEGRLYEQLLRIAEESQAKVVLMENVQGLLTSENGKVIEKVCAEFKRRGFDPEYRVINCALYSVPQYRNRLIILGTRDGIRVRWPTPHPGSVVSIRQALELRGSYEAGRIKRAQSSKNGKERGWWQGGRALDVEDAGYTVGTRDNYDMLVPSDDVARDEIKMMRDRSSRRAREDGAYRLNVEELRVLQGAPNYKFIGTQEQRHYGVGNMVPPPVAKAFAETIAEALS